MPEGFLAGFGGFVVGGDVGVLGGVGDELPGQVGVIADDERWPLEGFAGTVVPAVWAAFGVNAGPPDEVAVVPRDDVDVGAEFAFPVEFGRHPVEPDAPGVLGAPGA